MSLYKIRLVATLCVAIIAIFELSGCADMYWALTGQPSVFNGYAQKPYVETRSPGLYNLKGWNGGYVTYGDQEPGGIDIPGTVGYPLTVYGPSAQVVPQSDSWGYDVNIVSGSLPPGMSFGNYHSITGIPTERGHWIVRLKTTGLFAGSQTYDNFQQILRFQITGSGDVHE